MQFIKNIKILVVFLFILLFSLTSFSQEDVIDNTEISTDTSSVKKERKFKLFGFLKKKKREKDKEENEEDDTDDDLSEDENIETDSIENPKRKRRSFFNFLKKKDVNDSISSDSLSTDSINAAIDSIETKEKFSFFKKNKKDSAGGVAKPDKIKMRTWNKMNAEQQDSVFRAWDNYDKKFYRKKYAFTKKEVAIAIKIKRTFIEKLIYKRARKKPEKKRRKIINRQNRRYQKTIRYERLKKSDGSPNDSISDKRKYKIVNKQHKRGAKREAIRKNKVVLKYDKKENRLRRRSELSEKEKYVLTKGRGIRLRGSEKITFKRARRKQEKFTEKLLELRKKRNFALQSKNVQNRMKNNAKQNKKRDKEWYNRLFKKKKKKAKNKKHDSDEFPKRYHK